MHFLSSKNHFDTMFAMLCVIAGATSHTISDTSKTSTNQLNNHIATSMMDFILDANLDELILSSPNTSEKDLVDSYLSAHHWSTTPGFNQVKYPKSHTICALLLNILSSNQMKFCRKHQDILYTVLPQLILTTRKECLRITANLKWNCPSISQLLDRANPIGECQFYILSLIGHLLLIIIFSKQLSPRKRHLFVPFSMHP